MIKVGHVKDLRNYEKQAKLIGLDNHIIFNMYKILLDLDANYGDTRDIFNNDGGYIVFLKDENEWNEFDKETNGMLTRNIYDGFREFVDYTRVDYIINNETMINVYMLSSLFKE